VIEESPAEVIHLDNMDGIFVKNNAKFEPRIIEKIRPPVPAIGIFLA